MLALRKHQERVLLEEVERPEPGPGEVVVKVMCAGLCRTDLYVAQGTLPSHSPRVLGHECSGVICQLGEDVLQERLGRRVAVFPWIGCGHCRYCRADQEKLYYHCPERKFLGWHVDGCFTEFMIVPQDRCLDLDPAISFQAGAYLEPLVAALAVLRTPVRKAERLGVLGRGRIAHLTRLIVTEFAQCEVLDTEQMEENSFDLLVETEASQSSINQAFRALQPDGVLVLKSRPAEDVLWPARLQVEKEITSIAVSYGSLRMAQMFLKSKAGSFQSLWSEPVALASWQEAFAREAQSEESHKQFFLPQGL